jgi:acetylornithine deacetylase
MTFSSNDPVDIATWLMSTDSTSGRVSAVLLAVAVVLAEDGWVVTRIPVAGDRFDVLATAGQGPFVTLETHLDTVPPYIAPSRDVRHLFGRGSCDAKGIAAAMIVAANRLRARGRPVAMLFVVGEETTHDGAHAADAWARKTGFRSTALVGGEPTESTLAVGTKGAMRVIVRTKGKAAHSAYPHLGRSATRELVHLLAELDSLDLPRDELLGETTVNIGSVAGGVADNVVAPAAEARIMARLVGPADEVWTRLERWIAGRAELERSIEIPAMRLGMLDGFPTSVVAFATDIPALAAWGTPYLFGPGTIHLAHRDDEHVEIADLRSAADSYERIVDALSDR